MFILRMRVSRSPKRKPGSFALVALVGFDCLAEAFFILAFSIWFELGGFAGSETEAQMQYFAEEVTRSWLAPAAAKWKIPSARLNCCPRSEHKPSRRRCAVMAKGRGGWFDVRGP
jgi:hypothetical protein